jgi:hypothetical protein
MDNPSPLRGKAIQERTNALLASPIVGRSDQRTRGNQGEASEELKAHAGRFEEGFCLKKSRGNWRHFLSAASGRTGGTLTFGDGAAHPILVYLCCVDLAIWVD